MSYSRLESARFSYIPSEMPVANLLDVNRLKKREGLVLKTLYFHALLLFLFVEAISCGYLHDDEDYQRDDYESYYSNRKVSNPENLFVNNS